MLASSLDAVIAIDATGRVLTFNSAAEQTFGYRAEDALGQDVAQLIIPPSLRARHYAAFARHLETGGQTILNRRVELTGMRADGSEFPVELTVTRVPLEGPPTFAAYLRDIEERERVRRELLASRARIVEVGDRERRRIERNLHDGAQQRLLSIGLMLRQLSRSPDLPPAVSELIDQAQEEAGLAITELRELARGIHPATLTETGLAAALRGLALRAPLPVLVDVTEERVPDSVEIAFYFVAAEALANVVRHSGAREAEITLALADGMAQLRVRDDGAGGADLEGGSGLRGLVDRVEAIGGSLSVATAEGGGTTVTATAPTTGH
jgi:PAS domain S-box-containing protein